MAQLSEEMLKRYSHSPVHLAIARRDHFALKRILMNLPSLPKAGDVVTEAQSLAAEQTADVVSAVVDRRDVPGRETPLHLAVRLGDSAAVEMLIAAGADWSLQNEQGWSALQDAICAREEAIAKVMTRYYQPMAWAKWCRRLPRITSSVKRIRDLYMEITFNFESSVIPFIGRIAPSDTYRIWKRGSNLRADMTLAGFDGFKIQRSDQSFLFLGDGSEDGNHPSGSLLVLNHKDKQVMNALEGAGKQPSEAEIAKEVKVMSKTNMYRPGIDVTQAELIPQSTWRRQEKIEMVGKWKAKVYDMHNVMVSIKSRKVPGALTDEELLAAEIENQEWHEEDELANILTEEEKQLLERAGMEGLELSEETFDTVHHQSVAGNRNGYHHQEAKNDSDHEEEIASSVSSLWPDQNGAADHKSSSKEGRKGWLPRWGRKTSESNSSNNSVSTRYQDGAQNGEPERGNGHATYAQSSGKLTKLRNRESENLANECNGESEKLAKESNGQSLIERGDSDLPYEAEDKRTRRGKQKVIENGCAEKKDSALTSNVSSSKGSNGGEFKRGLRPVLWLTPDFPLKTEELLPLLDVLANKVKAVRRLRELLTTKLPSGTFPVKMAIPIVPTVRVVVTFNKFEELRSGEEFGTPLSSPAHFQDSKGNQADTSQSSGSWFSWIKGSSNQIAIGYSGLEDYFEQEVDPFFIPTDYKLIDMNEKKRLMKAKRSKRRKEKKLSSKSAEGEDKETRD